MQEPTASAAPAAARRQTRASRQDEANRLKGMRRRQEADAKSAQQRGALPEREKKQAGAAAAAQQQWRAEPSGAADEAAQATQAAQPQPQPAPAARVRVEREGGGERARRERRSSRHQQRARAASPAAQHLSQSFDTEEEMLRAVLQLSRGDMLVPVPPAPAPEVVQGVEMTYEALSRLQDVKVPLNPDLLNLIMARDASAADTADSCAICTEVYEAGEGLHVLPCSHVFHKDCLSPWLTEHSKFCPVCKSEVTQEALLLHIG